MSPPAVPRLQRRHFAFMRALLQGLDERESWNRYLRAEGEGSDLRSIRRAIAWIRDEFSAAARREGRPGTARLVRLDPLRFASAKALPTLGSFAAEQGLEDFSEAEQAEAYLASFPEARGAAPRAGGKPSQHARLIARQLDALRWLESHVAQDPRGSDRLSLWLNPAIARRLELAGLGTLAQLVDCVNAGGPRWWQRIPGIGALKADRVMAWLQAQPAQGDPQLGLLTAPPVVAIPQPIRDAVATAGGALVPFEQIRLPPHLDGRAGAFRAPRNQCLLPSDTDDDAVSAWLAAKAARPGRASAPLATGRAYRREAERLLLWTILERGKALSSLSAPDAIAYRDFLAAPPAHWRGARHHQRGSPDWRPLEGPLSPRARHHALTILRSLFTWLCRHGYLVANPFVTVTVTARAALHRAPARPVLGLAHWTRLNSFLARQPDTDAARRLRRAIRWVHATDLRLSEIAAARCGDLSRAEASGTGADAVPGAWQLIVERNGRSPRRVAVPHSLIDELELELKRHQRPPGVLATANASLPILARLGGIDDTAPWSASGLAKAIKSLLERCARELADPHASEIRAASAEILRHSAGSRTAKRRGG